MNTRRAVLAALRDAGASGVSGEAVARALGMSRAAVAKHVAALRAAGYGIEAAPGSGYALTAVPDLPLPEEVAPLLDSAIWADLRGGGETGSTNDDAKALARAGAPEGTVVLAARQTAGRGRFARAWSSPPGGLYLSVVLRPPLPLPEASPLPLAVSLGVARGLRSLGVPAALKWPNDVVLPAGGAAPGKLAGVLLEVSAEADALEWVVAGIGVNVRRPAGGSPFPDAAYAEDALGGAAPPLAAVAAAALDGVGGAYLAFLAGGFEQLAGEYEARWVLGGREVRVSDARGGVVAEGTAAGVDGCGRLMVDGPRGRTSVSTGEVTLRGGGAPR